MADDTAELALLNRPDFDELIANADRYFQETKPALSAEELLLRDPDFDRLLKEAEAYLFPPTPKNTLTKKQGHKLAQVGAAGVIATAATLTPQVQPPQISLPQIDAQPLVQQVGSSANQISEQISERVSRWEWGKEPVKTIETAPQLTAFDEMIKPMIEDAQRRRAERAKEDPEYSKRIDPELNEHRFNLVVYAYSEEHDFSYEDYYGFPTILSYDIKTGQVGTIHFSRDIRVPELAKQSPNDIEGQKVGRIYKKGDFDQMRWICERMTGLAMDYQTVVRDVVLRDALQKFASDGLEIDVAKDHVTRPYRLDKEDFGSGFIPKGKRVMSTEDLIHYISAEDEDPGGKEDERSYRKDQVIEVFLKSLKEKSRNNPLNVLEFLNFFREEVDSRKVETDMDLNLLTRGKQIIEGLTKAALQHLWRGNSTIQLPEMNPKQKHVFHSPYKGDGGVSIFYDIKRDVTDGLWKDHPDVLARLKKEDMRQWMLIPDGGDPYAEDLISNYWQSTRIATRKTLLSNDPDAQDTRPTLVASKPLAKELSLAEIRPSLPKLELIAAPEEIKFQGDRGDVDSNSPIHWDGDKVYLFNSSLSGTTRYSGTDIQHLDKKGEKVTIDKKFNGGVWIEATHNASLQERSDVIASDYKAADGNLYGWYHHEPANVLPSKTAAVDYLTAPKIGAMVSKDNGKSWHDLGFILENDQVDRETTNIYFAGGNGDFSVIPDREGKYFYFLYSNYDPDPNKQGIAVARIKAEDLSEPQGKLEKLNHGAPVIPAKSNIHKEGADFFWGPSVHFNQELGMYVILLNHAQNSAWEQEGIYAIYAKDLSDPTSWSAPQRINLPLGVSQWYPQVLGTAKGDTDKEISRHPRLVVRGDSNFEIKFQPPPGV